MLGKRLATVTSAAMGSLLLPQEGYSSLSPLRALPLDEVKIDKSFVSRMCDDRKNAAAVVRSTITLSHDLGLRTVAEGVEGIETPAALEGLWCDSAQGYNIARPATAAALTPWLVLRADAVDLPSVVVPARRRA